MCTSVLLCLLVVVAAVASSVQPTNDKRALTYGDWARKRTYTYGGWSKRQDEQQPQPQSQRTIELGENDATPVDDVVDVQAKIRLQKCKAKFDREIKMMVRKTAVVMKKLEQCGGPKLVD